MQQRQCCFIITAAIEHVARAAPARSTAVDACCALTAPPPPRMLHAALRCQAGTTVCGCRRAVAHTLSTFRPAGGAAEGSAGPARALPQAIYTRTDMPTPELTCAVLRCSFPKPLFSRLASIGAGVGWAMSIATGYLLR